jgi:hypothetical protein
MLEQERKPHFRDASHACDGFEHCRRGDTRTGARELDDNGSKEKNDPLEGVDYRGFHVQTELRGARPDIASPSPEPRRRQAVKRAFNVISVLAVVSACTTASVMPGGDALQDEGDRPVARLNTRSAGTEWMCVDNHRRPLLPDANGYAALPAGARVTIGSDAAGNVPRPGAHTCIASASFVPKAGQSYFLGFETEGGRCAAFVYREVHTNRMGLGLEPTLAPAADCVDG